MEQFSPHLLFPLVSCLLGVWFGYRLGRSERKHDRRRVRRTRLTEISASCLETDPVFIGNFLASQREEIQRIAIEGEDEARFRRKRRIRSVADAILALKNTDLNPISKQGKEAYQSKRTALARDLKTIARLV